MVEETAGLSGSPAENTLEGGGRQAANSESLESAGASNSNLEAALSESAGNSEQSETITIPWGKNLPKDFIDGLDAGEAASLAKFPKIGDLAKAYLERARHTVELESKLAAHALSFPGADAKPEEEAAFWETAGKPKLAKDYSFAGEPGAELFAEIAHTGNLTERQAARVYQQLNRLGKQQAESWELRKRDEVVKADDVLKREYGARYAEKINLFTQGCDIAGPDVKQLLYRAGLGGNLGIIKAFITYGQINAESGSPRGSGSPSGGLKSIHAGEGFNYQKSNSGG